MEEHHHSQKMNEEIRQIKKKGSFQLSSDESPRPLKPSYYGSLPNNESIPPSMDINESSYQEWRSKDHAAKNMNNRDHNNRDTSIRMQENKSRNSRQEQYRTRRSGRSSRSDPYASIIGHGGLARLFTKAMILAVMFYTFLILFGSLILTKTMTKTQWCPTYDYSEEIDNMYSNSTTIMLQANNKYENPDYNNDPCHYQRLPFLLYLTMEEADCCRRMFLSVMMGGAIGFERRSSDRPAGVRTMGLVSLGACFFTISSQLAFKGSTMGWDSSRVTAAIPSGCGFLGAGLIWKGTVGTGRKDERHEVHGLTTAAGVWLSAAIGTGCGGRLYFVSGYSCILVTIILRYGPKIYFQETEVGAARDVGNDSDMDDMTDDDGLVGEEEDENDSSRSNCSSLEAVREEGEISVAEMKNRKGRLSTADEDESNATISRTTRITATSTMEGVRVALVDANELKMFEAWKREREQISVQSSRNKTSSETGMVGIGRIGFDSDISCSDASSSRQYGR